MNIKKILVGVAAGALLLGNSIISAFAVAPWHVTGNYEITFFLDPDTSVTPYVHHATLNQTGSTVTGDGGYPATGGDVYHWNVTSGTQTGDSLNLTVDYDLGAIGTTMHMVGTIASDGTVSGTWDDNFGGTRTGTWSMTKGVSVPLIHTPANNAIVTQSALVKVDWTDSVGSNPTFLYQYQAYSDPGYTSLVYDSGMTLSASEIPTPGTPPGDYYVRVMAQNSIGTQSDWSNGPDNPYKITVIADPVATQTPTPTPALVGKATGGLTLGGPRQQISFNAFDYGVSSADKGNVEYQNFEYPGGLHYTANVLCANVKSATHEAWFMFQIPAGFPGLSGLYVVSYVNDLGSPGTKDKYGHAASADLTTATTWCENGTAPVANYVTTGGNAVVHK